MNNLENLYRQVIMDHYKNPRNKGLKGYNHVHLHNPSCGDDVVVEALLKENKIKEVNHEGSGCAICCSSASVMSELLTGKEMNEAMEIINDFYELVMGNEVQDEERLEAAMVYQGLSKFPARIKCATISWKAIEKLLQGEKDE